MGGGQEVLVGVGGVEVMSVGLPIAWVCCCSGWLCEMLGLESAEKLCRAAVESPTF